MLCNLGCEGQKIQLKWHVVKTFYSFTELWREAGLESTWELDIVIRDPGSFHHSFQHAHFLSQGWMPHGPKMAAVVPCITITNVSRKWGPGDNGGSGERILLSHFWSGALLYQWRPPRCPATFLLHQVCHRRLGKEAPGKGGQLCSDSAALPAGQQLPSGPCAVWCCHLVLHTSVLLAPWEEEEPAQVVKVVPGGPGRAGILHRVIKTGKSYIDDTSV